jgi:Xaa-Pro aminopeptidase
MTAQPPFDVTKLDQLLESAGLDVILVTTKHNVRYFLDGYQNQFFGVMDALGVGRYLPVLIYVRGRLDLAHFVGSMVDPWYVDARLEPLWVPSAEFDVHVGKDAAHAAATWLNRHGLSEARIGIESAFLPVDAYRVLAEELPSASFLDVLEPLETLRAYKTPNELRHVEDSSVAIVDSMLVAFHQHGAGDTKADFELTLKCEQVARGLTYEYCLISMGANLNRAPSDQRLVEGDVVSMDSGGQLNGYIGDVARMGVLGEPDDELETLLSDINDVQMAARAVVEPGTKGRDIFTAADSERRRRKHADLIKFVAHGMGLISHEAPRLTATGPVRYPATHADLELAPGLVLSIESWIEHPRRGFIKLEDTIAVTSDGHIAFGDHGRGWNRIGS